MGGTAGAYRGLGQTAGKPLLGQGLWRAVPLDTASTVHVCLVGGSIYPWRTGFGGRFWAGEQRSRLRSGVESLALTLGRQGLVRRSAEKPAGFSGFRAPQSGVCTTEYTDRVCVSLRGWIVCRFGRKPLRSLHFGRI